MSDIFDDHDPAEPLREDGHIDWPAVIFGPINDSTTIRDRYIHDKWVRSRRITPYDKKATGYTRPRLRKTYKKATADEAPGWQPRQLFADYIEPTRSERAVQNLATIARENLDAIRAAGREEQDAAHVAVLRALLALHALDRAATQEDYDQAREEFDRSGILDLPESAYIGIDRTEPFIVTFRSGDGTEETIDVSGFRGHFARPWLLPFGQHTDRASITEEDAQRPTDA